jgi:hypothetical protein
LQVCSVHRRPCLCASKTVFLVHRRPRHVHRRPCLCASKTVPLCIEDRASVHRRPCRRSHSLPCASQTVSVHQKPCFELRKPRKMKRMTAKGARHGLRCTERGPYAAQRSAIPVKAGKWRIEQRSTCRRRCYSLRENRYLEEHRGQNGIDV